MNATSRSAAGRNMLDRDYYVSVDQFRRDLEMIRRWWIPAARLTQLPRVGDFFVTRVLGEELIVVRTGEASVSAMHNVCRHRAARICDQSGHCRGTFRCPYHGWSYDWHGRLVAAPNMDGVDGFDPAKYSLSSIHAEIWEGFVMLSFAPAQPLAQVVAELSPLIVNWQIDRLVMGGVLRYEVAANWKLIVQNFSECYHCPLVHPTLNRLTPYRSARNQISGGPVAGGPMSLSAGAETMSMDGKFAATPIDSLTAEQRRLIFYYSVFPAMFISPHPDYVLVHALDPVAVDRTVVHCLLLVTPDTDLPSDRMNQAIEFWDQTNRQDWAMCERSQQGVQNPGYRPGPYSDLESLLAQFDQYYLQQLNGSSTQSNTAAQ